VLKHHHILWGGCIPTCILRARGQKLDKKSMCNLLKAHKTWVLQLLGTPEVGVPLWWRVAANFGAWNLREALCWPSPSLVV